MTRTRALGALVGYFSFAMTAPSSAETFTLSDALSLAYQTNPQLAQARAALEALDQTVAQAEAGWHPSINGSVSKGYDHGVIGGFPTSLDSRPVVGQVTVSMPVFRGGRTEAEINHALAQVHSGRAQLASTEQSVLLAAVTAYMDVVRDTADMEYNRENVATLQAELKDVQTELAAGAVTRTDAFEAEGRLARARADEALASNHLAASRAAFEDVIGRPAGTLQTATALPRVPSSKDAALDVALKQNPDLDRAKANERAANFAIDDAVGALLPDVSLNGQYQYLLSAPNASIFALSNPQQVMSVTAQLNVPIYQGGAEDATVRRATDLHRQAELAIVSAEREVRQNLDGAWEELQASEIATSAYQSQASADQNAINGVKQEQEAGERAVLDVLNAQQELFVTQVALAAAQHDGVIAAYRLLSVTGELTAREQALNVNLYDPDVHYNENADAWFGFGE